jgi:hypothetical protein
MYVCVIYVIHHINYVIRAEMMKLHGISLEIGGFGFLKLQHVTSAIFEFEILIASSS